MIIRRKIRVYGIVQGVGFRPFVSRTAMHTQVTGSVCNKGPYVEIFAEGTQKQVTEFLRLLKDDAPERSMILNIETDSEPLKHDTEFKIIHSEKVRGDIFVSPDIATCPQCEKELYTPGDPRYLHPFINCTACGPRLTILDSMPYDRESTSMGEFPMCPHCEYEYTHSETRRYHAQPVCCNDCGPEVYIIGSGLRGKDAILKTRNIIRAGGIAAIKGIGGFHLCCDATNPRPVELLRKLKKRPFKPFAVMMRDKETITRECIVPESGVPDIVTGPIKPITLFTKRKPCEGAKTVSQAAPDNPYLGVMLPYTPLHMLLFTYPGEEEMPDCLIMTSGNPKGAPICRTDEDALEALGGMCDIILSHNRKIRLRADDSVIALKQNRPYMIRRSRGYAPLPFHVEKADGTTVLAVGGELKSTFALAHSHLIYPSPYIGDLADLRSVKALKSGISRMEELLELSPQVVVCDLHPGYNSTSTASELAESRKIPLLQVQHHYAHILTCMAENNVSSPVIGISFDGTGYGSDGTIWGGEIMICDLHGFRRIASVDQFIQAGGDASSRDGWRIAQAFLTDNAEEKNAELKLASPFEFSCQQALLGSGLNCVTSTSAGRLFDAVSAILGLCRSSTCEGEASMRLQFAAERYKKQNGSSGLSFAPLLRIDGISHTPGEGGGEKPLAPGEHFFTLNTTALIRQIISRRLSGESTGRSALFFHETIARMITESCIQIRRMTDIPTIALSGGVMQNLLLVHLTEKALKQEGFNVLTHSLTAPNDSGIAIGQALYGLNNN